MKDLFFKNSEKFLLALWAFFIPIQPLLIAIFIFCITDIVTGLIKARVIAKREGISGARNYWKSAKLQKKIFDIVLYMIAVILAYYLEVLFIKDYFELKIHKLVAFIVIATEFWSNLENIGEITGKDFTKKGLFESFDKIRKSFIYNDKNT